MVPRMREFLSVAKKVVHPCVTRSNCQRAFMNALRNARMNGHFRYAQVAAHPWHNDNDRA